ncbi:MAG TPA: hypothetical protein VJT72_08000 [Pseudonocardiaceae bacterium]|nr:hypothetical protein [Pseudonocardiaceae bacterium]
MQPPSGGYPAGPAPLRGARPKEVEISFWLWISTGVFGVIGVIGMYVQRDQLRTELINSLLAQDSTADRSTVESLATAGSVAAIVIGLLFVAAQVLSAFLMRGGRNWARIVLAVLGGLVVLFGLLSLTAGSVGGLLQLVILIGAIVTMFLPAANAWFRPHSPEI